MKIYIRASRNKKRRIRAAKARMFDEIAKMIYEYTDIPSSSWKKGGRYTTILSKIRDQYYAGAITIHEYQDLMDMLQKADG